MNISRIIKHLSTGRWAVHRKFPREDMQAIEEAIAVSEKQHRGEIRFAVEAGLTPAQVWNDFPARERAVDVFSHLRIWDTEENTGVLIYLLLADHDIEIIADRGINQAAGTAVWEKVCHEMESSFRAGKFQEGVVQGIAEITKVLAEHFPWRESDQNELPNKPVVL